MALIKPVEIILIGPCMGTTDPLICTCQERIKPILFCYRDQSQHKKWMPPSPNWDVLPI